MRWSTKVFLTVLAGFVACSGALAQAQWPTKSIFFVVPFPPGGGTDIQARLVASKIEASVGQKVLVENRAGASGAIATRYVKGTPPDGHVVLIGTSTTMVVYPALAANPGFEPEKDFAAVAPLISSQYLLLVNPSLGVKTIPELVEKLKVNPGKFSYLSSGVGSLPHLLGEMFKQRTGTDMVHVAYQGNGPATTAILQGEVQVTFAGTETMPLVDQGKVTLLGGSDEQQSAELPTVTPIAKTLPGFNVIVWTGFFVPAATPRNVIELLRLEIEKALSDKAVNAELKGMGFKLPPSSSNIMAGIVKSDLALYRQVGKDAKITIQ